MSIPVTKRELITETLHGKKIADPYRWLEDGTNSEVKKWVRLQNKHTARTLSSRGKIPMFAKELMNYHDTGFMSAPTKVGERYFWSERKKGENQPVITMREGKNGQPRILVNPNGANKEDVMAISYWFVSPTGKYLVYGLSSKGTESATLFVMETESGKNLSERIPYTRYTDVCWLNDESGFFYARHHDRLGRAGVVIGVRAGWRRQTHEAVRARMQEVERGPCGVDSRQIESR